MTASRRTALTPVLLLFAALLGPAALAGLTVTPAAAAEATKNPSLEQVVNGLPVCWQLGGFGTNTSRLSSVGTARTGLRAGRVDTSSYGSGNAKIVTSQRDASCAVPVLAGHRYRVGIYFTSTVPVRLVTYYKTSAGVWTYWTEGTTLGARSGWTSTTTVTPAVPAGTTGLSYGLSMAAVGSMTVDDAAIVDTSVVSSPSPSASPAPSSPAPSATASATPRPTLSPTPTPTPTPTAPPAALFRDTFTTPDRLITNEYAYWNPTGSSAVVSPSWQMTSGSLFNNAGNGYSGAVDAIAPNASSSNGTNSSVFRLNSKRFDYGNVRLDMRLNIEKLGTTSATPAVDWDGIHLWLRYKSQYNLYYASVARRDGVVLLKKKCVGGNDNGGTYYALTPYLGGHPIPFGQWRNVSATVRDNTNGSVTLSVSMNGVVIASATDSGIGCAPLTGTGAVGVRGDNAQFRMDDFTVTSN